MAGERGVLAALCDAGSEGKAEEARELAGKGGVSCPPGDTGVRRGASLPTASATGLVPRQRFERAAEREFSRRMALATCSKKSLEEVRGGGRCATTVRLSGGIGVGWSERRY